MGTLIPEVPKPFQITEVIQKKYDGWIDYFKKLSRRIIVYQPNDELFTKILAALEKKTREDIFERSGYEGVELIGWPKKESIAFIVSYDSSLPGHEKTYSAEDCRFFCYGDLAFGITYFESDEGDSSKYSYSNYSKSALRWKYVAKLVRERIKEFQKQIIGNPPSDDEELFSYKKKK